MPAGARPGAAGRHRAGSRCGGGIEAIRRGDAGAAVAWIRNSVDDAIEARAALGSVGVEAMLFHARFAMGDRQDIEAEVLDRFGRQSGPDSGGVGYWSRRR